MQQTDKINEIKIEANSGKEKNEGSQEKQTHTFCSIASDFSSTLSISFLRSSIFLKFSLLSPSLTFFAFLFASAASFATVSIVGVTALNSLLSDICR